MLFCYFWAFLGKVTENFLFQSKRWLSQKGALKYSEIIFLNMFQNGKILRNIWICLNNCFWSNQLKGTIINKDFFLPKVSHIELNYVFLLFWSIFVEIHQKIIFLDKNLTISERSNEILRMFVLLNMLEKRQILRKIWICLNNCFWSNQ